MTKVQGYATIGAVLLGGVVFHASMNPGTSQESDKTGSIISVSAERTKVGEGPWLASCRYWAAVRPMGSEISAPPPQIGIELSRTNTGFNATVTDPTEEKDECGPGSWGIPGPSPAPPEIHAIIATISDPVHTHLALEFDRSIDALMQAAADNSYLASYYWIPWHSPSSQSASARPTGADQEAQRKREQQPGLVILKYSPTSGAVDAAKTGFYHVIYLFLVAESPALGVNGDQLQNALQYETQLLNKHLATLSMSKDEGEMAFIGPRWSGSAASLSQGLQSAITNQSLSKMKIVGAGSTSTAVAQHEISVPPISYISFGEDTSFEEQELSKAFKVSKSDPDKTAVLVEDSTVFGASNVPLKSPEEPSPLYIRFPRDIYLLRNAKIDQGNSSSTTAQAPSPYLGLSLKDPGGDDTIPKFSTTETALSQEAQLMGIERQLQKAHIRHILISASNILDEIFLARELRRACPNATIVFYDGGDLLVERDVDNITYLGSLSVSPFSLLTFDKLAGARRLFSDSRSTSIYNSASYIFWRSELPSRPVEPLLAGTFRGPDNSQHFPLIVTAVGFDGYYPVGILLPCASDSTAMLLNIDGLNTARCQPDEKNPVAIPPPEFPNTPSFFWFLLCGFLILLSLTHAVALYSASYWSPFTRDLAIWQNDQPRRRALYLHIATSMLVSMALVLTVPWFAVGLRKYHPGIGWILLIFALLSVVEGATMALWKINERLKWLAPGDWLWVALLVLALIFAALNVWRDKFHPWSSWSPWFAAALTLLAAEAATISTLWKTHGYWLPHKAVPNDHQARLYPSFNLMAVAAVIIVLFLMLCNCLTDQAPWGTSYLGLFFSYRSLHPMSGVSPIIPVLLLLLAWYLWAMFQTARLRFSAMSRPHLPGPVKSAAPSPLYVSDESLQRGKSPIPHYLFENIDSLLITRELAHRLSGWKQGPLNRLLLFLYLCLFLLCAKGLHIESLGRFLHFDHFLNLTAYEWLIAIFFYPLVMIALTGWLRAMLIWSELKNSLLAPLERMPFRNAFSRLSEVDWVTMLGQSGLNIRWRDMAHSIESVRQIMHDPEINRRAGWPGMTSLQIAADNLNSQIQELGLHMRGRNPSPEFGFECPTDEHDLPPAAGRRDLCFIYAIEKRYAAFAEELLEHVLIPYWNYKRIGFVNDVDVQGAARLPGADQDPMCIRLAEEFLAIRYVAFIRTVLVNIRHLMLFVSTAFVLAIVAWNSYPFQPRQQIDWYFTILMICLSAGFIRVFAQMHRNPILSRITATNPNELGTDFYIRLITFGGLPVLTWLAYQFPEFGGSILRLLQPSLQVAK
jgi:hypothetical protein